MSIEEDTELRDLVAQALETNGVLNKIRVYLYPSMAMLFKPSFHKMNRNLSF